MPRIDLIQLRRGTAAEWTAENPVLELGEYGYETDTRLSKIGDGSTDWDSLGYLSASAVSTDDLQDVTGRGATTNENMTISNSDPLFTVTDPSNFASGNLAPYSLLFENGVDVNNIFQMEIAVPAITGDRAVTWQDKDGTVAYLSDITSSSEIATYVATNTGTVTLDCNAFDSSYRILTGNTDFQFSNTPASGETFVKTLEVITTAGETVTFSTADKVTGTLTSDNTTVNLININIANYPTLGLRITVNITQ